MYEQINVDWEDFTHQKEWLAQVMRRITSSARERNWRRPRACCGSWTPSRMRRRTRGCIGWIPRTSLRRD